MTSLWQTRVSKIYYKEFGAYAVEMGRRGNRTGSISEQCTFPCDPCKFLTKADGSAEMDYPTFEAQAAEHSFKLTLRILKDIQG